MVTSSEVHEESRHPDTGPKPGEYPSATDWANTVPGMPPEQLQRFDEDAESQRGPVEPSPREVEEGALQETLFYNKYSGSALTMSSLDNGQKRVLYNLHRERESWTQTMADDADATFQLLYPDVAGSAQNGPL